MPDTAQWNHVRCGSVVKGHAHEITSLEEVPGFAIAHGGMPTSKTSPARASPSLLIGWGEITVGLLLTQTALHRFSGAARRLRRPQGAVRPQPSACPEASIDRGSR